MAGNQLFSSVDSVESAPSDAASAPILTPLDAESPPILVAPPGAESPPSLRLHPVVARSSGGQLPSLLPFSSRSFFHVKNLSLSAGELSAFADLNAAAKASDNTTQPATYKIGFPEAPSLSWPRPPSSNEPDGDEDEVHALPSSSGSNAAAASNAARNCQLNVFNRSDPNLAWINGHPYMNRGALGKGAFAVVKKMDLLTPLGYTVCRDENGVPLFKDVDGDMMLRPLSEREWEVLGGNSERREQLREKIAAGRAGDPAWAQFLNFSGLPCALKDITVIPDDATMDRCLEEVRLLKLLNGVGSEHIVRLYDSETIWTPTCRNVAIVMELGEMDFAHYLKSSMDAVEIFAWWRQMVKALEAVHSQGIIHSDLKPSNFILVRKAAPLHSREHEQYTLKLADFGVSRQLKNSQTHLSMANCPGTLLYFAPEMVHSIGRHGETTTWSQQDCKLQVTTAADIWAMGVILHEMLHDGSTPYGHFKVYGHYRVLCAIADEKAARIRTLCPRLLEAPKTSSGVDDEAALLSQLSLAERLPLGSRERSRDFLRMPAAQRQHDLLLGFQLAQLQHKPGNRPTASHLSLLCDTADGFFREKNAGPTVLLANTTRVRTGRCVPEK